MKSDGHKVCNTNEKIRIVKLQEDSDELSQESIQLDAFCGLLVSREM
jgi:hypothetical protein